MREVVISWEDYEKEVGIASDGINMVAASIAGAFHESGQPWPVAIAITLSGTAVAMAKGLDALADNNGGKFDYASYSTEMENLINKYVRAASGKE